MNSFTGAGADYSQVNQPHSNPPNEFPCPCPHFGCEYAYSNWFRNEDLIKALVNKFRDWHFKYEKGIWSVLRKDDVVLFFRCWTRFDTPRKRELEAKLKRIDKVIARKPCVLLTLTVDAKRHKCPVEAIKNLKKGFTKLVNWLRVYRKRMNCLDFDYIAVVEVKSRDKKGLKIHIHLHVLFVGIAWLAPSKLIMKKWDELGIGTVIDVRRVRNGAKASKYVLKYLFKTSNDLQNALLHLSNTKGYTLSKGLSQLIKYENDVDDDWIFIGVIYWSDIDKFLAFEHEKDEYGSFRFKDPPAEFWILLEEVLNYVGG